MKQYEKRLYQNNVLGYNLVIGFIILNTIYSILTLKNMVLNYKIGIFVMTNIILSLVSFLAAVKVKNYSILWSYSTFGIGIFQAIRLFLENGIFIDRGNTYLTIIMIISIVSVISGSIVSIIRSNKRRSFIIENNINVELADKGDLK